jgi:hypothetical protein
MMKRILTILIAALMKRCGQEAIIIYRGEVWPAHRVDHDRDFRFGEEMLKVEVVRRFDNRDYLAGRGQIEVNKERKAMQ